MSDLLAYTNDRFQVTLTINPVWVAAYDLTTVAWRLQIKSAIVNGTVLLDVPVTVGSATYEVVSVSGVSTGVVVFTAPKSAVQGLAAGLISETYPWEYGFTPPGQDFIRCDGGNITFYQGVIL